MARSSESAYHGKCQDDDHSQDFKIQWVLYFFSKTFVPVYFSSLWVLPHHINLLETDDVKRFEGTSYSLKWWMTFLAWSTTDIYPLFSCLKRMITFELISNTVLYLSWPLALSQTSNLTHLSFHTGITLHKTPSDAHARLSIQPRDISKGDPVTLIKSSQTERTWSISWTSSQENIRSLGASIQTLFSIYPSLMIRISSFLPFHSIRLPWPRDQ